jgi:hypothetical protein
MAHAPEVSAAQEPGANLQAHPIANLTQLLEAADDGRGLAENLPGMPGTRDKRHMNTERARDWS